MLSGYESRVMESLLPGLPKSTNDNEVRLAASYGCMLIIIMTKNNITFNMTSAERRI